MSSTGWADRSTAAVGYCAVATLKKKKREEGEQESRSARQVLLQHLMSQQGQINRFCSLRLDDRRMLTGRLGEGAMELGAEAY